MVVIDTEEGFGVQQNACIGNPDNLHPGKFTYALEGSQSGVIGENHDEGVIGELSNLSKTFQ